jgi:hypothetical protein
MEVSHKTALKVRAEWLAWAKAGANDFWREPSFKKVLPNYIGILADTINAPTYFMNASFGDLVDAARSSVPDELEFECSWMQSEYGWLWCEKSFIVPMPDAIKPRLEAEKIDTLVRAIGWVKVDPETVYFLCFQDFKNYNPKALGFGAWSYFTLKQGARLIDRIREFEHKAFIVAGVGSYKNERDTDRLHEMRWIYAAMHMMAQKMTCIKTVPTAKWLHKMQAQKKKPVVPSYRVIALRKLEDERERASQGGHREYQC